MKLKLGLIAQTTILQLFVLIVKVQSTQLQNPEFVSSCATKFKSLRLFLNLLGMKIRSNQLQKTKVLFLQVLAICGIDVDLEEALSRNLCFEHFGIETRQRKNRRRYAYYLFASVNHEKPTIRSEAESY